MTNHEVIEEDWALSSLPSADGYVHLEVQVIRVAPSLSLALECIASLSPLDMVNLANGTHDATGQRVWMGAFLFIEALTLLHEDYVRDRHVLELGCGTGAAGIATLKSKDAYPAFVHLTDNNDAALNVCRRNCERNLTNMERARCSIHYLPWGEKSDSVVACSRVDTILATDVLYDISSLTPLLSTVQVLLRPGGHFVLSHIPRASLPGKSSLASSEDLESYVIQQAETRSLVLIQRLRPRDICFNGKNPCALNSVQFSTMDDAGAAILILKKLE